MIKVTGECLHNCLLSMRKGISQLRVLNCVLIGKIKTLIGTPIGFPITPCWQSSCLHCHTSMLIQKELLTLSEKSVTNYRTEMEQGTLCALVSCKLNINCDCFKLDTPKELMKKAKVATMEYIEHTVQRVTNNECFLLFILQECFLYCNIKFCNVTVV